MAKLITLILSACSVGLFVILLCMLGVAVLLGNESMNFSPNNYLIWIGSLNLTALVILAVFRA